MAEMVQYLSEEKNMLLPEDQMVEMVEEEKSYGYERPSGKNKTNY